MKEFFRKCACIVLVGLMGLSCIGCTQRMGGLGNLPSLPNQTESTAAKGGIGTLGVPASTAGSPVTAPPASPSPPAPTQAIPTGPAPTQPSQTHAPAPTQSAPVGMTTQRYSCDLFTLDIPSGWQVTSTTLASASGTMQLYVFVTDPADSNNQIIFCGALEAFFASTKQRDAAYNMIGSPFEYAPVLDPMTAQELLKNWGAVYTFMQAAGTGFDKLFRNYSVKEILSAEIDDGSTNEAITSTVLCTVGVPKSDKTYLLEYTNVFAHIDYVYFDYYSSGINYCICLDAARPVEEFETLEDCLMSLDVSGFNEKYL